MTSKENYLVPEFIEPELAQYVEGGVGKIVPPSLKEATLGDENKTKIYQIWCHSPRVRGNSLGICNHSLGAIVGNVQGAASFSMLLECPKCRTAYALTVEVGDKVKLHSSKVVNLNRTAQLFVDTTLDGEKDMWIQIHEKKS